jgi:hypothetical protein
MSRLLSAENTRSEARPELKDLPVWFTAEIAERWEPHLLKI